MKDQLAAIFIIVAMTTDGIIGKGKALPWNIPEEMQLFKKITMDKTVIMGRHTFESIGHPLSGRNNIVISTRLPAMEDVQIARNFEEALDLGNQFKKEIFVIGGAEVFRLALPIADHIYISWIHGHYDGDVRFPEFDLGDWHLEKEEPFESFTHCFYSRQR